jgi:hypothetical protein
MSNSNSNYLRQRRSFLKAIGASAVAFPFFRLIERSAIGQSAGVSRLVTMYHPHAASSPLFKMQSGESETSFSLSFADSVLSPLESHKSRLAIIEGLDLMNAAGHDAPKTIFAGSNGTSATLDQFLAVDKGLGDSTVVTSLSVSVGTGDQSAAPDVISLGASGAIIPQISSPAKAFDKAFGSFAPVADANDSSGTNYAYDQGKSTLDFLRGDIERIRSRLAAPEHYKLDQHLTALRDIEKRLDAIHGGSGGGGGGGSPVQSCGSPTRPEVYPSYSTWNNGGPHADEDHNLHIDIITQAFACDITRFVSFFQGDLSRGAIAGSGYENQQGYTTASDVHNDAAHTYAPETRSTWVKLGVQNRYSYGKLARLMDRLVEAGVMDDTLIIMAGDMGNPSLHSSRDIPVVVAGNAGGKFKTGVRIKLAADCPPDNMWCTPKTDNSMTKLLVSAANAFGANVNGFGVESNVGPLSEIET